MTFKESVNTCLREKYATFSGRATRSEYWYFALFIVLAMLAWAIVFGIIAALTNPDLDNFFSSVPVVLWSIVGGIFWLGIIVPSIAAVVRRFHDRNISGWWYLGLTLLTFVPIVGTIISFIPIIICCLKGTEGPNKFGSDPLGQNDAAIFE